MHKVVLLVFLVVSLSACSGNAKSAAPAGGLPEPQANWKDSYSVGGQCYCATTYDHNIGPVLVQTPAGARTVRQVCERIGPGPGENGNPVYNDVQCGHGPPNDAGDEQVCPGRVDKGKAGCPLKGPTWNLDRHF